MIGNDNVTGCEWIHPAGGIVDLQDTDLTYIWLFRKEYRDRIYHLYYKANVRKSILTSLEIKEQILPSGKEKLLAIFFRKIEGHHLVPNHELFSRKITETERAAAPSIAPPGRTPLSRDLLNISDCQANRI